MVVAMHLSPLSEEHIQNMYRHATAREAVFRNVLVDISGNGTESSFFKVASIDDIFNKYVRIEGYVISVGNYTLGPSQNKYMPLNPDELLIYLESSGTSLEKLYQILKDDQVKFVRNTSVSMH